MAISANLSQYLLIKDIIISKFTCIYTEKINFKYSLPVNTESGIFLTGTNQVAERLSFKCKINKHLVDTILIK